MKVQTKKYPSKTTLNLVMRDVSKRKLSVVIPVFAVLVLAIAAFTKFAVIDVLANVSRAEAAAAAAETQLSAVSGQTTDYDEVRAEYLRCMGAASSEDAVLVDRLAVIDMVQSYLMDEANVSSFSVADNVLSVTLVDADLNVVSQLLLGLNDCPIVESTNVYTAGSSSSDSVTSVSMTIMLTQKEEADDNA